MDKITDKEWYDLGMDHRKIKKSIGSDRFSLTKRQNKLQFTFYKNMTKLAIDLDTIVMNQYDQYHRHIIELPGYSGSYLTELFFITDKDDQTEVIRDPDQLRTFAIDYLDRMNLRIYNNKKNFNILKKNISKICE